MGLVAVCFGGALGSGARYLVGLLAARWLGIGFPYGTLFVNVLGSFALACMMQATEGAGVRPELRLALGTGAMGGFTTYSTFNLEALRMIERGAVGLAVVYGLATVAACFFAGALGLAFARLLR